MNGKSFLGVRHSLMSITSVIILAVCSVLSVIVEWRARDKKIRRRQLNQSEGFRVSSDRVVDDIVLYDMINDDPEDRYLIT